MPTTTGGDFRPHFETESTLPSFAAGAQKTAVALARRLRHAAGDEVLKLFARIARDTAGPDAILVRLGGEVTLTQQTGPRRAQIFRAS